MRLLQLPDWAQEAIRRRTITAAHGKYLLMAAGSAPAMEAAEEKIFALGEDDDFTVNDLRELLGVAMAQTHTDLRDPSLRIDRESCAGCKMRLGFTWSEGGYEESGDFCLDGACMDQKIEAANEAFQTRRQQQRDGGTSVPAPVNPKTLPTDEDGQTILLSQAQLSYEDREMLVASKFDTGECQECEFNRAAKWSAGSPTQQYCFNVPCYKAKEREVAQERSYRERLAAYYDGWLRSRIVARLQGRPELCARLAAYQALGRPVGRSQYGDRLVTDYGDESEYQTRARFEETAAAVDVRSLHDLLAQPYPAKERLLPAVAAAVVAALGRLNLRLLGQHLEITLDREGYVPDRPYLDLKDKRRLLQLAEEEGLQGSAEDVGLSGMKLDEIRGWLHLRLKEPTRELIEEAAREIEPAGLCADDEDEEDPEDSRETAEDAA